MVNFIFSVKPSPFNGSDYGKQIGPGNSRGNTGQS